MSGTASVRLLLRVCICAVEGTDHVRAGESGLQSVRLTLERLGDVLVAAGNRVLVATGTGLAPYMSMIRTELTTSCRRRFAIIHGARHSWDLGYQGELLSLAHVCPQLKYVPIISRPRAEPIPWRGSTGYCQDAWKSRGGGDLWGFQPQPDSTHVFLCGNPAMIVQMAEILAAEGFREHSRKTPGQVHMEKYW